MHAINQSINRQNNTESEQQEKMSMQVQSIYKHEIESSTSTSKAIKKNHNESNVWG